MINRPIITISLKPHLADFLRHEFHEVDDCILINRSHDIGKMIHSQICQSEFPVKRIPLIENPVKILIPVTQSNRFFIKNHFIYIPKWGEEKIQDYLQAEFNRTIRDFYEVGYVRRYRQKEITDAIIKGFNIKNDSINFEAIKKIDVRKKQKYRKMIFNELQFIINQ